MRLGIYTRAIRIIPLGYISRRHGIRLRAYILGRADQVSFRYSGSSGQGAHVGQTAAPSSSVRSAESSSPHVVQSIGSMVVSPAGLSGPQRYRRRRRAARDWAILPPGQCSRRIPLEGLALRPAFSDTVSVGEWSPALTENDHDLSPAPDSARRQDVPTGRRIRS